MSALDSGRYSVAAGCVGVCQGSLEHTGDLAEEQWGPVAEPAPTRAR
jgi:alkylation response protein AidB-like acyl-CoA dehydrogenase